MKLDMQEPKCIWWAWPRKLCALERPGGGGRSHRPDRRAAEVAYLKARGVRLIVSVMGSRHNLAGYEAAGLDWHHAPLPADQTGVVATFDELELMLRHELRRSGAVAVHGDSRTDFVAALCAALLCDARRVDARIGLARAARAGLTVTPEACALVGVKPREFELALKSA